MKERSVIRNAQEDRRPRTAIQGDSATKGRVVALMRGIRVLEAVVETGARASLAEITTHVDLPKTTVHRLLQTFVESGYVETRGDGYYSGGPRVLAVAGRIVETVGYARLIGAVLRELQDHTDETIHFGILSGLEAVYVEKLGGRRPYQMASQIGKPLPLHCTAIGKAILSFLPDDQRHSLINLTELSRRTERTITSRRGIEEEVQRTRERGYSLDDEENEDGIRCVGVPVFDYTGRVIGGISVSAPVFHLSLNDATMLVPALLASGRKASEAFGATSDPLAVFDEVKAPSPRVSARKVRHR
jgi:IclR family transcriptional regulator, KDG regulon repressor